MRSIITAMLVVPVLVACGGGGGGSSSPPPPPPPAGWQSGVYQASSNFVAQCAAPRTGTDPVTGIAYPDMAGTTLDENNWLRSWTNELYLWFNEVVDQDPSLFATASAYFDVLKTTAMTSTGAAKDRFHFTYPTDQWESLSQNSVQVGYGAQWVIISGVPPRQVVVAYTEPGSPAVAPAANLARGAQVLTVDGVDLVNDNTQAGIDTLNAAMFPATAGATHTFQVQDAGSSTPRTITMTSANITSQPVQDVGTVAGTSGSVGYMLFNDHLATSEGELVNAFTTLQAAGVTDLVLDIRYNGGGYLDIASEVAYMIAGAGPTAGQTFELTQFNSKNPTTDPVTGQPLAPVPFHSTTQGFSTVAGQALPTLNLSRVFVLTGPDTCSASESIINSLRGVNVAVVQVGSTTCGKPYGFYPQDNCGTTYFSIEFRGVNAQNFGDYADGFSPANSTTPTNATVPGCSVADDFTHALGDPAEARLAAALGYMASSTCPPASGLAMARTASAANLIAINGRLPASPLRQLRILRSLRAP
jgi:carboxyl-terminal processing protease